MIRRVNPARRGSSGRWRAHATTRAWGKAASSSSGRAKMRKQTPPILYHMPVGRPSARRIPGSTYAFERQGTLQGRQAAVCSGKREVLVLGLDGGCATTPTVVKKKQKKGTPQQGIPRLTGSGNPAVNVQIRTLCSRSQLRSPRNE